MKQNAGCALIDLERSFVKAKLSKLKGMSFVLKVCSALMTDSDAGRENQRQRGWRNIHCVTKSRTQESHQKKGGGERHLVLANLSDRGKQMFTILKTKGEYRT